MKINIKLPTATKNTSAFTIVEVLVVAPIVIFTIAIFIGLIITITGDSITSRSQNILSYTVQDSLNRIEQDVSRTTNFLSTNSISFASPQGYNNDTTSFTNVGSNGNMLILSIPATNKNPMSNDYTPIYLTNSPYSCSSADVRKNTQMMINIVYFVKDGTLWRRTLMPSNYTTAGCTVPYQKPSCASGQVATMCASEDIRIADNITSSSFTINYFTSASSSTSLATSIDTNASNATRTAELNTAKSVNVSIGLSRTIAGRSISRSDSQRMIRSLAPNATSEISTLVSCPTGFIVVPGSSTYGTGDFCVMKYEAKCANLSDLSTGLTTAANVYNNSIVNCTSANSRAVVSVASGNPISTINQTDAISYASSTFGCTGCKLITEAEWMTLAQNVLSVASNWSGNAVGSGFIYSGHNDNSPANSLPASTDTDGYSGTGNVSGNQRRTLTLTNGEVIWDLAGNLQEWTSGQMTGGQPTGSGYAWREWTAVTGGSFVVNPYPSGTGLSGASTWTSTNGIGQIWSSSAETVQRGFLRGGVYYYSAGGAGVLGIMLNYSPSATAEVPGFRVTK